MNRLNFELVVNFIFDILRNFIKNSYFI